MDSKCVLDSVVIRSRTLPKDKTMVLRMQLPRELVQENGVHLEHVVTGRNLADELTKPLLHTRLVSMVNG